MEAQMEARREVAAMAERVHHLVASNETNPLTWSHLMLELLALYGSVPAEHREAVRRMHTQVLRAALQQLTPDPDPDPEDPAAE